MATCDGGTPTWQAHDVELTLEQARVLGCLIEKAATTPDNYPLSSNALTNACNQSTNRDPVVDYPERDVDTVMLELRQLKLARTVTGTGHRVGKHKHIVDEAMGLDGRELAVLAVLLLRGAQTVNEIATRTERYGDGPEGDTDVVNAAIDRLAGRTTPLVERLSRKPGEREPRVAQRWTEQEPSQPHAVLEPAAHNDSPGDVAAIAQHVEHDLAARVATLEAALITQTRRLDDLLDELGVTAAD